MLRDILAFVASCNLHLAKIRKTKHLKRLVFINSNSECSLFGSRIRTITASITILVHGFSYVKLFFMHELSELLVEYVGFSCKFILRLPVNRYTIKTSPIIIIITLVSRRDEDANVLLHL